MPRNVEIGKDQVIVGHTADAHGLGRQRHPRRGPAVHARQQVQSKSGQAGASASSKAGESKKEPAKPESGNTEQGKGAAAPVAAGGNPADPSKSTKVAPIEIFRDPRAEKLADVQKYPAVNARAVTQEDINALQEMAQNVNVNVESGLINRVVDAMAAKLTDHANIQALIEPAAGQNPNAATSKAIQEASSALLEPLFAAKAAKNLAFLSAYNRVLLLKLRPLLKNHLIPRIQAAIILGQSANPDALQLFIDQIKDDKQTIWVKLWAMEGIANIVEEGHRLPASNRIDAGKVIADFLKNEDDIPWPAQLRALEALGAMRQGYRVNAPKEAEMASAAMRLLTDYQAKPEVRSEAARALGLMEIGSAVRGYNYPLIAHSAGTLAAALGTQIGSNFKNNPLKSRYLTVLLAGPVFEAFDGVTGMRDSGLVHMANGEAADYVSKVFDLVKPVVKASSDLLLSPSRQVPDRQKDLAVKVTALKEFLSKNPPRNRSLVQGGPEFPVGDTAAAGLPG
ncbi:MAG: HEAT repeat domain-containing protein [Isosphaeraceae bacterium]